jgi:hypothetical protein
MVLNFKVFTTEDGLSNNEIFTNSIRTKMEVFGYFHSEQLDVFMNPESQRFYNEKKLW